MSRAERIMASRGYRLQLAETRKAKQIVFDGIMVTVGLIGWGAVTIMIMCM